MKLSGKERIIKTLRGEDTDRAPIWLRDQFNLGWHYPLRREKILDVVYLDPFADSWTLHDPNMKQVRHYYQSVGGDIIREFVLPDKIINRLLCTPPSQIRQIEEKITDNNKTLEYIIETPKGRLNTITSVDRNVSTMWIKKHLVENESDLKKIMSVPFHLDHLDNELFIEEASSIGEQGLMLIQVDTPLITVSGMMAFEDFLMLCVEDEPLLRELCDMAYERISRILQECFKKCISGIFRLNGSEQATPPMNSLDTYEKFVYRYEKLLIKQIHDSGNFAAIHCHGKIKNILPLMVDMGVDLLDPIEPPPGGNLTFPEAKEIAKSKITLAGNLESSLLEEGDANQIEEEVKAIFTRSEKRHTILTTSSAPITSISDKLRRNLLTMIDSGIKYGRLDR